MEWPLLECLSADDRQAILSAARRRRFARGDIVFHEGDPGDTLHLLERGYMAVRVTTPLGEVVTTAILRPGTFFGEMALVAAEPRNATVVALEAAETMSIHRREFDALRQQHRAVDQLLIAVLADEVRALSSRLLDSLYLPVDKRLARQLADLSSMYGRAGETEVAIPMSQDDLAMLVGTTRPTANRVLKELESEGVLAVHRGRIDVLDRAAIERRGSIRAGSGPGSAR